MAHVMELKEAVQHFQQYMTNKNIANKLGISPGQLMKYANGTTKSCSDKVVDNFYDKFSLDGQPILLDYFPSESEYLANHRGK